jgi:hypothetical protein
MRYSYIYTERTIVIIMSTITTMFHTYFPERDSGRTAVRRGACARRTWPLVVTVLTVVIGAASAALAQVEGTDGGSVQLPASFLGAWKVESVRVDLGTSRRLLYQRDDPRLIGDVFTIRADSITSNTPEARPCSLPSASLWQTTAKDLVAITLAPYGFPGTPPTVKDYELPLKPAASVAAYSIRCNPGRFGPAPLPSARATLGEKVTGTWIVLLANGELAVRWYDQTILLLKSHPW